MNAMLSFAAGAMQGSLHGQDGTFDGVSTDTRSLREGELFVALSGPNFNGNAFVAQAQSKGAAGAVVTDAADAEIAQIVVDDTRVALGLLGAAMRAQHSVTVVGITGSNGKTTLKEMVAACLSTVAPTLATQGNLNNDIGMPLMLTRIDKSHRFAVLEMGANHAGEIANLTALAKPDVVTITNAGAAHLEGFGSVDGVAHAKAEILQGESRPDAAVLNADDEYYSFWLSLVDDVDVLSFGLSDEADFRADQIETGKGNTHFTLHLLDSSVEVSLPLAGIHNVRNACAAAAIATVLGATPEQIKQALEALSPVSGRLQPLPGQKGATLFDDSYNANPLSVIAAAEFVAALPGKSWFVLGDMFELGDSAEKLHNDVGASIHDAGVDRLFTLGDLSREAAQGFGDGATSFDSIDDLVGDLSAGIAEDINLLIKGSRGMRMERVVSALRADAPANGGA